MFLGIELLVLALVIATTRQPRAHTLSHKAWRRLRESERQQLRLRALNRSSR